MRRTVFSVLFSLHLLSAAPVSAAEEGIADVLARSQQTRLELKDAADASGPRAQTVRASFERLIRASGVAHPVELQVVRGDTVAEAVQGHVIVANESLAEFAEGERLFILAHELGHIELRHWEQTERLYQKWIPGMVTPERTDPVATQLSRDASGLAQRQEFEADAYALKAVRSLGRPWEETLAVFMHLGASHDTATHPSTARRLAALRVIQARWADAAPSPQGPAGFRCSNGEQAPERVADAAQLRRCFGSATQPTTRNELIEPVKRPD